MLATNRYSSGSGTDVDPAVKSDDQSDTNESEGGFSVRMLQERDS